jgi:hypothetical protein
MMLRSRFGSQKKKIKRPDFFCIAGDHSRKGSYQMPKEISAFANRCLRREQKVSEKKRGHKKEASVMTPLLFELVGEISPNNFSPCFAGVRRARIRGTLNAGTSALVEWRTR